MIDQFLLRLVPVVDRPPRAYKSALGDRIENAALSVLENLIEAAYSKGA
jgi:hypothetical protein